MMDINGASVAPVDPAHAPFSRNNAAGPYWLAWFAAVSTGTMLVLDLLGLASIPYLIAFAPVALLAAHVILFCSIRNAVHLALQMHQHDTDLKKQIAWELAAQTSGHLSAERVEQVSRSHR